MNASSFLKAWAGIEQAEQAAPAAHPYGDVWTEGGHTYVRAHSGVDALDRVANGITAEGNNSIVANHKGRGVYEIKTEPWRR